MAKDKPFSGPIALGLRPKKGGCSVVAVAVDDEPRVMLSTFLATAAEGDRLSLEPYRIAFEMTRTPDGGASPEAAAAVAEGRKRQEQLAAKGLDDLVRKLKDEGCIPIVAALLVNRVTWLTDLLSYSLSWPEHAAVAEGLAVREAVRLAVQLRKIELTEVDEKSLHDLAANVLDVAPAALDARLKALGATAGKPWRKEQKAACLAAWMTLATQKTRAGA